VGCSFSYEALGPGGLGLGGTSGGDGDVSSTTDLGDGDGDGDGGSDGGDGDNGDGDGAGGGSSNTAGSGGRTGGTTGGSGGTSAAGGSSSGGSSGDGGSPAAGGAPASGGASGSGGVTGDFEVTTWLDEDDMGATVALPLGNGLSLREAIELANSTAGHQTITAGPGTINLTKQLPFVNETADLIFDGTVLDGAALSNAPLLRMDGPGVLIQGVSLVSASYVGFYLNADDGIVRDSTVTNSTGQAMHVSGSNVEISGNLIVGSIGILYSPSSSSSKIWFNTLVQVDGVAAINPGQASGVDLRNNIIVQSTTYAVAGACSKFTFYSNNLFWANVSGINSQCAPGADSPVLDPLFTDAQAGDYSLVSTSPAVDAGVDVGLDRAPGAAENYLGVAPDLGRREKQ